MIEIKTQEQFELLVDGMYKNELVKLYTPSIGYYNLTKMWNINYPITIQGVCNPMIKCVFDWTDVSTYSCAINILQNNVVIDGINLIGRSVTGNLGAVNLLMVGGYNPSGVYNATRTTSCHNIALLGPTKLNDVGSVVKNCTFEKFRSHCITLNNSHNCKILNNDIIIENNIFSNTTTTGIQLKTSNCNIISHNNISPRSNVDWTMSIMLDASSCNNIVKSNILGYNRHTNIHLNLGSNGNIIADNIITGGTTQNGIYVYSSCNVVSNNNISSTDLCGIVTDGGNSNAIVGNYITKTKSTGMYIRESKYNSVDCNTIVNCTAIGIYIWGTSCVDNIIVGNHSSGNTQSHRMDNTNNEMSTTYNKFI